MKGRIVGAALLLAIGVAWLLDVSGRSLFPGGWGVWWPSVLILVGLAQLATQPREWRAAAFLVALGAAFQAWALGFLPRDAWKYVAPLALIGVALFLLLPRRAPRPGRTDADAEAPRERAGPEDVVVFGERRFDAPSAEYRGGELTAVFGALEADLTRATLPAGGARLKATSVFGGVKVRVPRGWRVEVRGTPILGRTEDRTSGAVDGPKLDVEAVAVLGNVEVTSA